MLLRIILKPNLGMLLRIILKPNLGMLLRIILKPNLGMLLRIILKPNLGMLLMCAATQLVQFWVTICYLTRNTWQSLIYGLVSTFFGTFQWMTDSIQLLVVNDMQTSNWSSFNSVIGGWSLTHPVIGLVLQLSQRSSMSTVRCTCYWWFAGTWFPQLGNL